MHNKWWILAAMICCFSMILIDSSVLPVALPAVQKSLGMSPAGLQWAVNAYMLTLTAFVLPGGKLGDILGQKKTFIIGIVIFGIASILCAMSPNGASLIAARALKGMGGALLIPATGAIILHTFPQEERGKAMGYYLSIGSVFLALGPTVGGILTESVGWEMIFWMNIPFVVVGSALALKFIQNEFATKKEKISIFGYLFLAFGMGSIIFAIMQSSVWGWSSWKIIGTFAAGLLLTLFTLYQKRELIDFPLYKIRPYLGATIASFCVQFVMMISVFWPTFLQQSMGYSPAQAGVIALFSNVPMFFAGPLAGKLTDRYGPFLPMMIGFVALSFSCLWFAIFKDTGSYFILTPSLLALGIGITSVLTPSFVGGMAEIAPESRGVAAGMIVMVRQFGSTLGLAVIGSTLLSTQAYFLSQGKTENGALISSIGIGHLIALAIAVIGIATTFAYFGKKRAIA